MSEDEGGWARTLEPGVQVPIDQPGSEVIIIGEKPDVADALKDIFLGLTKILTVWRERSRKIGQEDIISVLIQNDGNTAIRAVIEEPDEKRIISPHERFAAAGRDYIELWELGG